MLFSLFLIFVPFIIAMIYWAKRPRGSLAIPFCITAWVCSTVGLERMGKLSSDNPYHFLVDLVVVALVLFAYWSALKKARAKDKEQALAQG